MVGDNRLYINESQRVPEGTLVNSWSHMDILRGITMERKMVEYRLLPNVTESKRAFGKNSFTKITYRDAATKQTITRYVKELNNAIFEYTVGEGGETLAGTILSTIQFPKQ